MIGHRVRKAALPVSLMVLAATPSISTAHDGPPFPIVSNQVAGAYRVSIWTDPDATDDGTAEGKFWVILDPAKSAAPVPAETAVTVTAASVDGRQPPVTGRASPDGGAASRQYVALHLDHEGVYAVTVTVAGPLGTETVQSEVDATYDLRPPPFAVAIYMIPFVLLGGIWAKVLWRRRRARASRR